MSLDGVVKSRMERNSVVYTIALTEVLSLEEVRIPCCKDMKCVKKLVQAPAILVW